MRKFTPVAIISIALLMAPLSDAQAPSLPDFDGNGVVDFPDFLQFVGKFGARQDDELYESQYDLDGDGAIAFPDFLIFVSKFGKTVPLAMDMLDFPLRALHAAGNWGDNTRVVEVWEWEGKEGGPHYIEWLRNLVHGDDAVDGKISLIPSDYIEWLNSLHVEWIGLSVALFQRDYLDSTVERIYPQDVDMSTYTGQFTFSDEALRQMIRELRGHGFKVYLTLALQTYNSDNPYVKRWLTGNPYGPKWSPDVLPEQWFWCLDHPDHKRSVTEFWETYTQEAVHFAQIAQEEDVQMYSLGTESDYLFRTRSGDFWPNHFRVELQTMVDAVRSVYHGLLTYDMHTNIFLWPEDYGPGSNHLWEDLDLDIIGLSAYFPVTENVPTSVISVAQVQARYNEIFDQYLKPLAERNPTRPILFLEFASQDIVAAPARMGDSDFSPFVFTDKDGNGLDDGRETQVNMYQGFINAMNDNPGVVDGAFFFDNWMTSDALWDSYWARHRNLSIKGKLAEEVIWSAYQSYKQGN